MTVTSLKVRVQRRAQVKARVIPRLPVSVTAESPVLLDRTGGAFDFSLDLNALVNNLEPYFPPILSFDTVYAELFGVSPLNSAAANDVAFGSLIASLGTGGKRIVLPHGRIEISSEITLTGLQNLIIEGKGSLDLTYSGNFGTVICYTGAGSGNIINMQNHRGIWWRDVQVVYTSNSFTGTIFNCASSFSTGSGSGFENVQVYQITNNAHNAGQCWYLKNNVDVTFKNCYAAHASFGWVGLFSGDVGETNMIKMYGCTSIALKTAAIANPVIGWTLYGHNFELGDAGVPAGIITSGSFDIKDLALFGCKFADSTANGAWINFSNNTFNFTMMGGDILAQSGTVTGILFNGTFHACPTIMGVLFSDLTTGINFNAPITGATVVGNSFLSVTTPISGPGNLDTGSLRMANNPGTVNGAIAAGYGGTGQQSYTIGDILYASGTGTLSKLADAATGNALISGGVGAAPSYGKIGISTHVSGLGTGIATFLGTPSSANLAAALTDETGTGAAVFAGSPAFTGTPTFAAGFNSLSGNINIKATTGGDVAAVRFNTANASESVGFGFQDNATTKWSFFKATTNNLRLQDFANSTYLFDATPGTAATGGVSSDFSWRFLAGTAVPAGGTAGLGLKMSSTTNLGVFFGSGAPTLSAAQGSLYIRTDGSSTSTRLYVNTNGSTGWTNVTTAA